MIIDPELRNSLASAYRERICAKMGITPYVHQRRWWAATDGLVLHDVQDPTGVTVRLRDNSIQTWMVAPRPEGVARFVSDLGAFKVGKSFGSALWAAGFACMPARRISLIGSEYDICEPEFSYLIEFLLSDRGMGMKAKSVVNRPRAGDMYLELDNGTRYDARSWERRDSLKGKEIDAYLYCEAYQLPGIECFTSISQNLRARRGFAVFPTTPDRPWVKELHQLGHGADPEFCCVCGVEAEENPLTFDEKAKTRDQALMTREKFAIHYGGKLGDFVGRVFQYQRGDRILGPAFVPDLFKPDTVLSAPEFVDIPPNWELVGGADTGTYYTALLVAFSPDGDAFVIDEFPNYRYVAGVTERDEDITIPEWAARVTGRAAQLGRVRTWIADANSQFKKELIHYGITILPNKATRETRTEITREYFQHNRVFLAPWLTVLPYELENAAWPEEASLTGKFERVKDRDHTLDCLEHILSKRPTGRPLPGPGPMRSWAEASGLKQKPTGNTHLGVH